MGFKPLRFLGSLRSLSSASPLQADGSVSCKRTDCVETCPYPIRIPGQCCPDCSAGDGAVGACWRGAGSAASPLRPLLVVLGRIRPSKPGLKQRGLPGVPEPPGDHKCPSSPRRLHLHGKDLLQQRDLPLRPGSLSQLHLPGEGRTGDRETFSAPAPWAEPQFFPPLQEKAPGRFAGLPLFSPAHPGGR